MSDQKPTERVLTVASDAVALSKAERGALELKIAELTGAAEYLSQTIAMSQGHAERLEKELEDLQRTKEQAESELMTQQEMNVECREEKNRLEMEIKKGEAMISSQQERIRILGETIYTAERRSKHAIESFQNETESKLKAMRQEYETEKERFTIELDSHRNQTYREIKVLTEELEQYRKKQQRALEIEYQDMKRKAEETVTKILAEGRSKNEALIKATESTALEVHRESESAAKRLVQEANQKSSDIIRTAQLEAEEVRRRSHNAEVSFLKEKNGGLAELKLMVSNAKDEAQVIVANAMKEASEIQYKVEKENEARITAANTKISMARKASEIEKQDLTEKANAELVKRAREQEAVLARKIKEADEHLNNERKRFEDEARNMVASARERAQAIIETANHEKNFKYEELKALESSMTQSARQSAASISHEAEKIALKIVEDARSRTRNIEKIVETIIAEATDDAAKLRSTAEAYAERIKRDLPNPEDWDAELANIRQQEQDNLHSLIEPTVKNYLRAMDQAVNAIFLELPPKWQNNQVILEFAEAISNIQHKKNYIKFGDMIPKLAVVQPVQDNGSSMPQLPLKKSS